MMNLPEGAHHGWQYATGTVYLADNAEEGCGEDVGHEEDGQDDVVLVGSSHPEVFLEACSLSIA